MMIVKELGNFVAVAHSIKSLKAAAELHPIPGTVSVTSRDGMTEVRFETKDHLWQSDFQYDLEEALVSLRRDLEASGLILQCNRFLKRAFVSSALRQASAGSGCYLVRDKEPVTHEDSVASLEWKIGMSPSSLSTSEMNHRFVSRWISEVNEADDASATDETATGSSRAGPHRVRGRVKSFNKEKGFGFITPDDGGPDIYFHISEVRTRTMSEGDHVVFEAPKGVKGPVAKDVDEI
jgi:cold shock protein